MKTSAYYTVLKSYLNIKAGRIPAGPIRVIANVTGACQSLCKTCNWGRDYLEGRYKRDRELTRQEFGDTFKSVKDTLVWLSLGGGEPTMRPDLAEIALDSEANCPHLSGVDISTNAIAPATEKRLMNKLVPNTKLDIEAAVSLDGNRELHDFIRGQEGNYDTAIETFKWLQELSKQYPNLHPHFNYTVSDMNAGHMSEYLDNLRKEGIEPSIDNIALCFAIQGTAFSNVSDLHGLSPETFNKKYNVVKAQEDLTSYLNLDKKRGLSFQGLRHTMKSIDIHLARDFYLENKRVVPWCAALRMSMHITPVGDLFPCTVFWESLGNIRDYNFDLGGAWKSDKFNAMRERLKRGCLCGTWSGCEVSQIVLAGMPGLLKYT